MSLLSWLAGRGAQSRRKPTLGSPTGLQYTPGFACHMHGLVEGTSSRVTPSTSGQTPIGIATKPSWNHAEPGFFLTSGS